MLCVFFFLIEKGSISACVVLVSQSEPFIWYEVFVNPSKICLSVKHQSEISTSQTHSLTLFIYMTPLMLGIAFNFFLQTFDGSC